MGRVAIVSDTTAYLPANVVEQNDIRLVSLYVNFSGDMLREADIRDYPAFFDRLRSADEMPTTSQPSVGDFLAVYEPLLAEGRDIVSIHISGGLSGTPEAARQAREALERDGKGGERVHVMDSSTAAGGLGMVVLGAVRGARAGGDVDAVLAVARETREKLKMWFAIDTLEFLKRSGRIGAARAWIRSTLQIKPILTVESEISPIERVRTSARAFERMVDDARQRHVDGADGWVVQHIQSDEQGRALADRCREIYECEPLFYSEIGPVLAVHTGPGLLGVGAGPARQYG